ncbi:siderophore synthetase component/RimJ/RimL family protein N-acetyltransferase [Nocardioides daedukensis]|uniref:Lysine N-acyltransferase MbtK n=1 Tax=Nocardioides daedukensis TaxID=634462 RepID=A0A7Y9UVY3_9ACTN|nr:GNAT family N-acetyltransferase [Nocardioides daedukensis]NYG59595.1 siderophore synthetase component/RimJ/RimL family protein N-acetyltransferase [Nocardioides daedukensis]
MSAHEPRVTFEPVDVERDAALLHEWVTHPRSVYWMMGETTPAEVAVEYGAIAANPHHHAWLGRVDGEPAFLAETYDPQHSELAGLPDLRAGDIGMHVLVAPTSAPVSGFTTRVFTSVMEFCFEDPSVTRVVVEPDVRNQKIAALNAAAGFVVAREIPLHSKTAALSFCTREAFAASRERDGDRTPRPVPAAADHLNPENLERAQAALVAKAIAEFSHERLLAPRATQQGWRLTSPGGQSTYDFTAQRFALEHWVLDPASVVRTVDGAPRPLDVQEFIVEFAVLLGIPDALLPTYLEELASTLASAAWKLSNSVLSAQELLGADYQAIEAAMTEGHPSFVANNGRIGYGSDDFAAYAPETGSDVRLVWVAVRRSAARLSLSAGLDEANLYRAELGQARLEQFEGVLTELGLSPADYLYLPLHPWQWTNRVTITFAPDVARRDIVFLGESQDDYRAQQSIRTFFNRTQPERSYVKTALAIQNMGFLRGLSPRYMAGTPEINDWVHELVQGDEELQARGFGVLREWAAIGYTGDAFHALGFTSPYQKMLAALWRESPFSGGRLAAGERLATMASLLHRDAKGNSLVAALVTASPLTPTEWVRSYLRAYLRPLVHCLLAHDLVFMPHGENLVMVLRDDVPVRLLMKDIGEEVAVLGNGPLPAAVERIRAEVPLEEQSLSIHTDVFDGFLRHLSAILDGDGTLPQASFWGLVRECIEDHLADHPELAEAAARQDLLRPEFRHSCLNRLQLRNTLQMVDLADQSSSLIFAGTLENPAAPSWSPADVVG